jgi:hypothetical protein
MECTSCCDYPYCNEEVPYNDTAAQILSTISAPNTASRQSTSYLTSSSRDVIVACVVLTALTLSFIRQQNVTLLVGASDRVLDRRKFDVMSTTNDVISNVDDWSEGCSGRQSDIDTPS